MKIKFYGVRGSYPRAEARFLKYGGNTPCIIVENDNNTIIFDAGTGLLKASDNLIKKKNIFMFITHTHYDHLQGFPFFSPFFNRETDTEIYGPSIKEKSFNDIIKMYMNPFFLPFSVSDFGNRRFLIKSLDKEIEEININGVIVKGRKSNSHPLFGVYLFSYESKGKKIVYATDINLEKEKSKGFFDFIDNTDVLIIDSYFSEKELDNNEKKAFKNYGHSTFESALKLKDTARIKKLFFYHYNPEYDDEYLDRLKNLYEREGVFFSKEGKEVIL
jgi:phosphoribosyl 1,2-cyclic phosphodiesterase